MTQTYTRAVGMFDTGRVLHVLYGHGTGTGFKWDALCGCVSSDQPRPLYHTPDVDSVTCKVCLREMDRVRKTNLKER